MLGMLAMIFCAGLALWSWLSPATGLTGSVVIVWCIGLLLYAQHAITKPHPNFAQRFFLGEHSGTLSDAEVQTFLRYHVWFMWTLVAVETASALAVFRIASLIASVISVFVGYYPTAIGGALGFFAFGPLTVKLNPPSWLGPAAKKGNPYAVQQAAIVNRLGQLRTERDQEERRAYADTNIQQLAKKKEAGALSAERFEKEKARYEELASKPRTQGSNGKGFKSAAVDQRIAQAWGEILKSPEQVPRELEVAIREVFIPLGIYAHRFIDNLVFLENDGMTFRFPADMPKPQPTPSLAKTPHRMEWPIGQPTWFIAAFPDVSEWVNDVISKADFHREPEAMKLMENRNQRMIKLFKDEGLNENSDEAAINKVLMGPDGKTSPKHCRLMAEWYSESTGKVFETGVP